MHVVAAATARRRKVNIDALRLRAVAVEKSGNKLLIIETETGVEYVFIHISKLVNASFGGLENHRVV